MDLEKLYASLSDGKLEAALRRSSAGSDQRSLIESELARRKYAAEHPPSPPPTINIPTDLTSIESGTKEEKPHPALVVLLVIATLGAVMFADTLRHSMPLWLVVVGLIVSTYHWATRD